MICEPAEDADLSKYEGKMDIVFTSPPYFSVERYSYDDTQSWVRHKDIDDWNKLFLHEALGNIWKTLKHGGLLMVNISDVNATTKTDKGSWSDKKNLQICDPMNDYINTFEDSKYIECFGMEMAKRPNCIGIGNAKVTDESNRNKEFIIEKEGDTFGEPVWVWQKIE